MRLNFFRYRLASRSYLAAASISLILSGCAGTPPPPPGAFGPAPSVVMPGGISFTRPQTITHIVGPSETLWRISKTYGTDIDTLMRVNRLSDPEKIKNGQRLIIPNTFGPRPIIPLYPSNRWSHIVIHHTATEGGNAHSIDQLHHKRGFGNGLGYHFLIDNGTDGKQDGQIEVGPRWIKQQDGAHANAGGMNEKGIGISLVGNYSERPVTQRQLDALAFLVKTLQNYYRIPNHNVIRHSDVPGKNTECPGTRFPWVSFRQRLG